MTLSQMVLGLDLGVTSVGWALVENRFDGADILSPKVIAAGVRIFPATVEDKTKEPKNAKRRASRGTRRLLRRKRERRERLREILAGKNLLPEIEAGKLSETFDRIGDPYELRVRGLTEKLEPFEIGRAIFHLAKRRGFLSNRKSGKSKDDGVVYEGIAEVKTEIENKDYKTLGEFLNSKDKKRGFYTARKMVEDEFEKFWTAQSKFYPDVLSDYLKAEIKHIIFYQRPIQSQRGLIGRCGFETDKKRCDLARQEAQRLRFWQDINNLELQNRETLAWRKLTAEEKAKLAAEFEQKKEITYRGLRKLLKISEDARINLEANEKKLYGNKTAVAFRKAIGKIWDEFSDEQQTLLTEDFFRIESEISLRKRLKEFWKFSDAQIEELLKIELENGYSRVSLKAIKKILPLMQNGLRYDEAVMQIYGDHRKQFDLNYAEKLSLPPKDLRNPIVSKALHELRKVVNAILKKYGKPDRIHLEMARDLKLTKKQKDRLQKQQNQNKRANEEAEEFFRVKFGLENVSGTDKLKYRLWKEAGECCPYTGEKIAPENLLDDQLVDIEHIIPYSRSFDDSLANKTICLARFNRETKKNKTPFEIFGADEQKYFEMLRRIEKMPFGKQRKFQTEQLNFDEMVGRQLSDTRYISKEARGYLLQLYDSEQAVTVISGGATANLRRAWGLDSILSEEESNEKNRFDHRHHAIDAIVIALTNRTLFQYISKLAGRNRELMKRNLANIETPWANFRDDVADVINSIVVSHAPTHRVRGALLEAEAYKRFADGRYVHRVSLDKITSPMIEKIVDETIKEIVKNRLNECGDDPVKAFAGNSEPLFHQDKKTPIKKVRVFQPKVSDKTSVPIHDESGNPYKYYKTDDNHHVEIYENLSTEEREAKIVSRFEAARNIGKSIKKGKHPHPVSISSEENQRFLFSFCKNDYVEIIGDDNQLAVYRVQKMSGGESFEITLRPLNEAFTDNKDGNPLRLRSKSSLLKIVRKLQVDPLGHLAQAND